MLQDHTLNTATEIGGKMGAQDPDNAKHCNQNVVNSKDIGVEAEPVLATPAVWSVLIFFAWASRRKCSFWVGLPHENFSL